MHAYRFESVATKTANDLCPGSLATYLPGEIVANRYRLTRELGRGGMGVVWAAQSLALGVEVAVKLIHSDVASGSTSGRMAREAQAAARLSHPSLVRVFDFGFTSHNHPYLVMELVQGETLRDQLERDGAIAAIAAVQMLLPIADGLRAAHERGIVHRDLKPDNILVSRDGLNRAQLKLLDFGIAKDATAINKLTQTGCVIGTPQYISPEQAKGLDSVDARSDVWSFCVMLYELLTATLPFDEPNYNAQLFAIIERPPAKPSRRNGDARLWQIILRGLAKDPAERWPSIGQLGEALASWLHDHDVKVDISGNSIRTVWLDNASTHPTSASRRLRFAKPVMGSGQSRIPPAHGGTLRGAALVLAVAASVFGLFELTFAKPKATPPLVEGELVVTSQPRTLVAARSALPTPQASESPQLSPTPERGAVTRRSTATGTLSGAVRRETATKTAYPKGESKPPRRREAATAKDKNTKANSKTSRHDFGF